MSAEGVYNHETDKITKKVNCKRNVAVTDHHGGGGGRGEAKSETGRTIHFAGQGNRYAIKKLVAEYVNAGEDNDNTNLKATAKAKLNLNLNLNLAELSLDEESQIQLEYLLNKNNSYKPDILSKLAGYKAQDVRNNFNLESIITFDETVMKLLACQLTCHYCRTRVLISYHIIRHPLQWTLDRLDNEIGHEVANVVVACLQCNLQRKTMCSAKFLFTKQLNLTKLD